MTARSWTRAHRSPAARAAAALVLGLGLGLIVVRSGSPTALSVIGSLEPVGTVWVNAIRMTVIPLIVSSLIVAVSGAPPGTVGKLGTRALLVIAGLLTMLAIAAALVVPAIFSHLHVDPVAAQSLRASAAPTQRVELPTAASWLVDLVPVNAFKAAADGAMLPLVVFTLLFALALGQLDPTTRAPVSAFFTGVSEAIAVLVRWVLALAPIGVFALATGLAVRLGTGVLGAAAFYMLVMSGLLIASTLMLYIVIALVAPAKLARFARAALPPQIIAATTRSSMAPLPVMLHTADTVLHLPRAVSSFGLPFASSTFRYCQPLTWQCYVAFASALYAVPMGAPEITSIAISATLMSFSVPGIPSGGLYVVAPFLAAVGIPVEIIGVLIALDLLPDVFKSLTNVTGHLAVVTLMYPRATAEAAT